MPSRREICWYLSDLKDIARWICYKLGGKMKTAYLVVFYLALIFLLYEIVSRVLEL